MVEGWQEAIDEHAGEEELGAGRNGGEVDRPQGFGTGLVVERAVLERVAELKFQIEANTPWTVCVGLFVEVEAGWAEGGAQAHCVDE